MPTASSTSIPQQAAAGPNRVGDILLEKGLIDRLQLETALEEQGASGHRKLLGEVLVNLGFVTEEQVMATLAEAYGVPFARISSRLADPSVVELLPRDFLEKQRVLPLFLVENKLILAVCEPANVFLLEEVERMTGYPVQIVAATPRDIDTTLQAYVPNANVYVIDEIVEQVDDKELNLVDKQPIDLNNLENSASQSPVIKLVNYLVYEAVQENASDIHVEPGDGEMRVRYRIDGQLYEKMQPPARMLPALVSRLKIMAGLDIAERRLPQDGSITAMVNKRQVDLRVSIMPGRYGEKVVIRVIDPRSTMTRLEKIGLSYEMLEQYRRVVHQSNGIVLVTGPTGSGKSTTLYATLREVSNEAVNVSTVEDPVEYQMAGINQFETNEKVGFTFATALRSLLRQDPDVIMVGEVRDQDTARIAIQAALTGHLVLSTLHTNDAPSAITRLYNIGVEPYLISASVRGVLAQRLVRKVCSQCKEPGMPTHEQRESLHHLLTDQDEPIETVYQGRGCSQCRHTGYAGRIGVYELYVPGDHALDAVSRGANLQELRRIAVEHDQYITLRQDGLEKLRAGVTTVEELIKAIAL